MTMAGPRGSQRSAHVARAQYADPHFVPILAPILYGGAEDRGAGFPKRIAAFRKAENIFGYRVPAANCLTIGKDVRSAAIQA